MFYPEKEEGETALGLDGEANNATDCIWQIICAISGTSAIPESEINASEIVWKGL